METVLVLTQLSPLATPLVKNNYSVENKWKH